MARVFISYSHDSPAHKARVLGLADLLVKDGVDCDLDAWIDSPPEGWPNWMRAQVRDADFVLVVCTDLYERRVSGREKPGIGKGAAWEGTLISQQIYDAGGRNTKFIPIVFGSVDAEFRPDFLRPHTYYDVSTEEGYEALYRRLTDQPARRKPPLGTIRKLAERAVESSSQPSDLHGIGYLHPLGQDFAPVFPVVESLTVDDSITAVVSAPDEDAVPRLAALRKARDARLALAHGLSVYAGRLSAVTQQTANGRTTWTLRIVVEDMFSRFGMEMGFNNISADEIAELRTRRILLNDELVSGDSMLAVLVSGMDVPLKAASSPFPSLYGDLRDAPDSFITAARLVGATWLYLSGTVEFIRRLDLRLTGPTALAVDFEGQRRRQYANRPPHVIRLKGTCLLA
ncbi:MAG TPA: TIR domain-containing protein [Thermoanaerobaculia bacterium]|nr:TIR domain-containing protein [Thermoanaerobaculia bacterium]